MKHRLSFGHLIELHNKAVDGNVNAQAELNAYAKEQGFDTWDEYWQSTIAKIGDIGDIFRRIAQETASKFQELGKSQNIALQNLFSDLKIIGEYFENDPAYQALEKRSEEPSVLADPVLSIAMEYLDDIDIGELLEKIREKQGNPTPIVLPPIQHTKPIKLSDLQEAAIAWVQRDGLTKDMGDFLSDWADQDKGWYTIHQVKIALRKLGKMGVIEKGPNKRWRMKIST